MVVFVEWMVCVFKGTGHYFETLSVGSVPGTDHSQIYAFLINNRFQAKKMHLYACVSVVFFLPT